MPLNSQGFLVSAYSVTRDKTSTSGWLLKQYYGEHADRSAQMDYLGGIKDPAGWTSQM